MYSLDHHSQCLEIQDLHLLVVLFLVHNQARACGWSPAADSSQAPLSVQAATFHNYHHCEFHNKGRYQRLARSGSC